MDDIIWTAIVHVGAGSALFPVILYSCMWSPLGGCRRIALPADWELLVSDDPANSGKMTYYVMAETDVICWRVNVATLMLCSSTSQKHVRSFLCSRLWIIRYCYHLCLLLLSSHLWLIILFGCFFDLLCDSGGHCELLLLQMIFHSVTITQAFNDYSLYDTFCMLLL